MIRITGIGDHDRPDCLITMTGIRNLPPYSPDLNPIEMVFAKLKALHRKASERTVGKLWDRIGKLLQAFSSQECENYLIHQGYSAT
jgi:transposase